MNRAIALVGTIVLARLLVPADFGEFALALLVVTGVTQVAGLGLSGAAIRSVDYGRPERAAYLQLVALAGAVGSILLLVLAGPLAGLLGMSGLADVIRALAAVVLIEELAGVPATDLQRRLRFRQLVTIEIVRSAVTVAVAVALAVADYGVWSLVVGHLAGTVLLLVLLTVVAPAPTLTAPGSRAQRRSLLHDGRGFLLQRVTTFTQQNVDYLLVGALLGARSLGFYSMAYRLSELPANGVAEPVARVTFPRFAQMRDAAETLRREALLALKVVTAIGIVPALLLSALAAPFVESILGSPWLPMVAALEVLGVWGAVRVIQTTQAWVLNATGAAGALGRAYVIQLVVSVPALVGAALAESLVGVALVMLASQTAMALVATRMIGREIAGAAAQWQALRLPLVGGVVLWVTARVTANLVGGWPVGLQLAAGVVVAVAAYATLMTVLDLQGMRRATALLRRKPSPADGVSQ